MTIRVAIMGFGRMGRNVFRALYPRDDIEVVAINDIADPKALEYLLRFDSLQGSFPEPVHIVDGYLYARGRRIPVLHGKRPGDVPWFDYGAEVVIEPLAELYDEVSRTARLVLYQGVESRTQVHAGAGFNGPVP